MASEPPDLLAPLLGALRDLVAWVRAGGVPAAVIGGVAASILGRPRLTRDVDALILLPEGRWRDFLAAGASFGLVPRIADALAFAQQARVLLLHHRPSGIDVDVSLGALPFEEELLARAVSRDVGGVAIPLPTPEDLLVMKAVAHRPRDLADIEAVLAAQPKVDLRRVRRLVREFATALEAPELFDDLETILRRKRKKRRGPP